MNTYEVEKGKKGFQSINSFLIEWDIAVNKIKKLKIIAAPEGTGVNGCDVKFYFGENYYQMYDTFKVEKTGQLFIVTSMPQRLRDNCFLVIAKILDNSYDSVVDYGGANADAMIGLYTRFVTNYHPEMHDRGYAKYQSNVESMRTYISTHRVDVDMSAQYQAMEDIFISIAKDGDKSTTVYKLNKAEKDCLDTFMEARNGGLLYGKCDVDPVSGKAKVTDEIGREIITGDGLIPQIERFATKFVFNKLNVGFFEKAMQTLIMKSEKPQGATFTLICNSAFYHEWQRVMAAWIGDKKTDGAFLYSKGSNGYWDLGATYEGYEYGGKIACCLLL